MVSFCCEVCNDTLVKKKLIGHFNRCPNAVFTCIDCNVTFEGDSFKSHTSCITESEKYEKGMHKGKPAGKPSGPPAESSKLAPVESKTESKKESDDNKDKKDKKEKEDKKEKKEQKERKEKKQKKEKKEKKNIGEYVPAGETLKLSKVMKTWSSGFDTTKKDMLKKLKIEKNDRGELVLKL